MATVFADTIKGTTICAVKRNDKIAIAGDGQVTQGESVIMKGNAVKLDAFSITKLLLVLQEQQQMPLHCPKS